MHGTYNINNNNNNNNNVIVGRDLLIDKLYLTPCTVHTTKISIIIITIIIIIIEYSQVLIHCLRNKMSPGVCVYHYRTYKP